MLQSESRRAIEKIRNGAACPQAIGAIELHGWLTALIGRPPQQNFFAEAAACHEGVNKDGCLKFDVSSSFRDLGESAPRFVAVDKRSRAVTTFDRARFHLVITCATEDSEMKRLSEGRFIALRPIAARTDRRRVLAGYIERHSAAQQSRNAANGSDTKGWGNSLKPSRKLPV